MPYNAGLALWCFRFPGKLSGLRRRSVITHPKLSTVVTQNVHWLTLME